MLFVSLTINVLGNVLGNKCLTTPFLRWLNSGKIRQEELLYDEMVNSRKSKLLDIANLTKKELVMMYLLRHLVARKLICFEGST